MIKIFTIARKTHFMVNFMFELKNQEQVPAFCVPESVLVFSE